MATLLLILLKQWKRCVGVKSMASFFLKVTLNTKCDLVSVHSVVATAPDILAPLSLILESVQQADKQLMERTKTKIFSALISVLQIQGLNGEEFVSFMSRQMLQRQMVKCF